MDVASGAREDSGTGSVNVLAGTAGETATPKQKLDLDVAFTTLEKMRYFICQHRNRISSSFLALLVETYPS
jgi:hypothetical protein